jgi:hypothetical protein
MRKVLLVGALLAALAVFSAAKFTTKGESGFCMQLNGGPFSGDLGFFRFNGGRPAASGKIVALTGRVAGLSPVFGTITVAKDGSFSELGATFFADADEGQFDVTFNPPKSTSGDGYGDYGTYGTAESVTADIVSCSLEP